MQNNKPYIFTRRNLLLAASLLVAIVLVKLIATYLNTATVDVSTPNKSYTITIEEVYEDNNKTAKLIASGQQKISKRLKAGDYRVVVQNQVFSTTKAITVKARQNTKHTISPKQALVLEPVLNADASDLVVGTQKLTYVDNTNGSLVEIDADENKRIVGTIAFKSVAWADSEYGIGQTTEGKLYEIINGTASELSFPHEYEEPILVNYAVSKDRHIYVSNGNIIYSSGDGIAYKKIYSVSSPTAFLHAGKGVVAITNGVGDEGDEPEPGIVVLSSSGQKLGQKEISAYALSWSPDGKQLLIGGSSNSQLVNNNLSVKKTLPNGNIVSPVWLNNEEVVYSVGNKVWLYDSKKQMSAIIANGVLGASIGNITISPDSSYLFMSSRVNDNVYINKVSLSGEKAQDYVYQLPVILPDNSHTCSLEYSNFSKPTIIGRAYADIAQSCNQAVSDVFSIYDIDTGLLRTKFIQLLVGA